MTNIKLIKYKLNNTTIIFTKADEALDFINTGYYQKLNNKFKCKIPNRFHW